MAVYKQVFGEGEDVVLIHGWGCDLRHMQPIVDMLSPNYRITNIT
ncbi:alpha/beta fold hydrolase [Candidiatus Paracoxiella cheracis]